jgi:hypothetical protein
MTYAIVKCRAARQYRIVELVEAGGGTYGLSVEPNGRAGWFTFTSKAEAFKAARALVKSSVIPRTLEGRVYEETPFSPMTSKLQLA